MNLIETIQKPILEEMRLFSSAFAASLESENLTIQEISNYIVKEKGKQLRPIMVILSAKMCGKVNNNTINAALAIELLHTASLIHDDIVDDTSERRGKPSINAKWTNKIAVYVGDYLFSKSLFCATRTENLAILATISNIGIRLTQGELQQLNNSMLSNLTQEKYLNVIKNKTAELFASCAQVGGLSVGVSESKLVNLRNYGNWLGLCFQIKDDIFDYSENINVGKPTGIDLIDGKITLPLIYALENAPDSERELVKQIIDKKTFTEENIKLIIQFVNTNGGIKYSIEIMEQYKNKAIEELSIFDDCAEKQALIKCAEYAALRKI
jgi:octaprenyl-diphosphate synthase